MKQSDLKNSIYNLIFSFVFALILIVINNYVINTSFIKSLSNVDFAMIWGLLFVGTIFRSIKKQFVYFSLLLFSFAIQLLHWSYFGTPIIAGEIYRFFTQFAEIVSGIGGKTWLLFLPNLLLSIGIIASFFFVLKKTKDKFLTIKYTPVIPIIIIVWLSIKSYKSVHTIGNVSNEIHLIRAFIETSANLLGKYIPAKITNSNLGGNIQPTPPKMNYEKSNIVLIVGESLTSKHMSLFGYEKPTTPLLDSLYNAGILTIKKSTTQAVCTDISLISFFNILDSIGQYNQVLNGNTLLFKLAKDQGYKTYFISSQSKKGMSSYTSQIKLQYVDVFKYSTNLDPACTNTEGCLDEKIQPELDKIDLSTNNNFIVLQLYGSHEQYNERYPESFHFFKEKDYKYPQGADYDNSIRYTDYNIAKIIQTLKNSNAKIKFFMMSDHGECQGEEDGAFGHLMFRKYVFYTPYIYSSFNIANDSLKKEIMDYPYLYNNFNIAVDIARAIGYNFRKKISNTYLVNGIDFYGMDGYQTITVNDTAVINTK
ncbi:MAG: phosphoethanolamine transferase [Bacteroidetes bacterium]|nr:phosphoethanolamine transferase [Bacteroidota bacterium]